MSANGDGGIRAEVWFRPTPTSTAPPTGALTAPHFANDDAAHTIVESTRLAALQKGRKKHPHRYLAELDFRYNRRVGPGFTDTDRALTVMKVAEGKRSTYRQPD